MGLSSQRLREHVRPRATVEVYSWDHVYVLDTSVPPATKLREKRPSVYGRTAPLQRNLGNFARRAEVIVLESSSDGIGSSW